MHASEYQEELEIPEHDDNCTAFQELKDEAISLQQQRTLLNDQQALLDKVAHTLVQCDIVIR